MGDAANFWAFLTGAFACAVLAGWTVQRGDVRPEREALLLALGATSLWGMVCAATGPDGTAAAFFESLRNLAWLGLTYRLLATGAAPAAIAAIRPVLVALVAVELMLPLVLVALADLAPLSVQDDAGFEMAIVLRLAFIIGSLVLVHNLHASAATALRSPARWQAAALAVLWICDLNYYTVAYLAGDLSETLEVLRGLAPALVALFLALAGMRAGRMPVRPSRAIAFQTLSLLVIGLYLVTMVGAAQSLAWFGDAAPPLAQIGFVFTSAVLALIVLPSGRVRGWMKVTVAKHFFQHRYDYRAEWLRFTGTIGRADRGAALEERVIQALGDITDSAAGLLLVPGERGELTLAARWQWRTLEVPAEALPATARALFERDGYIVALDDVRAGIDRQGEAALIPDWLRDEPRAWAIVPLLHFERLTGVVVLARPTHPRELDWEDFDLLRVVGRQLASYLAEHAGHEALLDATRFDEFNRRIAFVMHDVKNLTSQLTLLSRNAERHGENPAFRADMLVTVRNAADKLNGLIAKLSRYGASPPDKLHDVDPNAIAAAVAAGQGRAHPVSVGLTAPGARVIANHELLEQVLVHLVQNAIDASTDAAPVVINVRTEGFHAAIEIVDGGTGMAPDFVRNRLFKPFVSTKPGGFGIGAFEARELVRAMQGRLDVESREGLGSRFTVRLPLVAAAGLFERINSMSAGDEPAGAHEAKVA